AIGDVTVGVIFTATSGLSTTADTISLTNTTTGGITVGSAVTAGGANGVTLNANAAGSGNGNLAVNAAVSSSGGAITLGAYGDVTFSATGDVSSGNGNVVVGADTDTTVGGVVTLDAGTTINAGSGTIAVTATGNITLTGLTTTNTTTGAVSVTSTSGSILDAGDTTVDITANASGSRVSLSAATGIGTSSDDVDLAAAAMQATNSTSGGIFLQETNGLSIGGTGVSTGGGNGAINIDVVAGALSVDSVITANGSGTVTLTVAGALTVAAGVSSTSGNLSFSGASIALNASNASASTSGNVSLTAATGGITDGNSTSVNVSGNVLSASSATGIDLDTTVVTASSLSVSGLGDIAIDDTAGGLTVTSAMTTDGTITLTAAAGNLSLVSVTAGGSKNVSGTTTGSGDIQIGNVSAAAATITLTAAGGITDSNAATVNLTASSASLTAVSGIGDSNALETNVTTIAFSNTVSGTVELTEVAAGGGFTVGSVGTVTTSSNTAAGGTVALTASSPIVFAVNTTSAGTLTAQALEVSGAGDNITVNASVTVRSTSGSVVFEAGDNIVVSGTVQSDSGNITLDSGFGDTDNVALQTLDGTLTASSGTVTIDLNAESGDATQGAAGTITASVLALLATGGGTGAYVLAASTTNNVGALTASVGGAIDFFDTTGLTIGSGGVGVTTSNDDATFVVGAGNISLAEDIALGTGALRLQTNAVAGSITQTSGKTVVASSLGLRAGTGGINLPTAGNDVDTLAATTTGSFAMRDVDTLTLGTVAVDGVFTPAVTGLTAGGSLELVVGGDLTITQSISASGQTVRLASTGGGVSESGSATITAGTLGVRAGGGNIALGNNNDVDNLAAFASGSIAIVNTNGVAIGDVTAGVNFTATSGLSTTADSISLTNTTAGGITVGSAVTAGG
ncbi:MAG: beta strand repeat-containing protein, partial [Planctomycetota bacterium]